MNDNVNVSNTIVFIKHFVMQVCAQVGIGEGILIAAENTTNHIIVIRWCYLYKYIALVSLDMV